jgi:transcriptional regulator with XRE-family HTH domain
MDYHTDEQLAADLGQRVQRLRERRGYSKQRLADAIGQPARVITTLEEGRGSLYLLVAVLRQLGGLDQLERFLAEPRVPLELNDPRQPSEGTVMSRRSPHSSMAGAR